MIDRTKFRVFRSPLGVGVRIVCRQCGFEHRDESRAYAEQVAAEHAAEHEREK